MIKEKPIVNRKKCDLSKKMKYFYKVSVGFSAKLCMSLYVPYLPVFLFSEEQCFIDQGSALHINEKI